MAKKENNNQAKSCEDWLPIIDIKGSYIEVKGANALEGNQYVTGVRVEPKNIFIQDELVQSQTIRGLTNFYNTLDFEFWLMCCDRPVDINLYKSQLEIMYADATSQQQRKLIAEDLRKVDKFIGPEINAVDTEFYILFKTSVKQTELIQKRVSNMISGLASAGLNCRQITEEDIRVLLDSMFNDSERVEFGTVMSNV
jgi:hypothetical protein